MGGLTVGIFVLILWPGMELHECEGKLVAKQDGLTAIKNIVCVDGRQYESAVGVPESKLIEATDKRYEY